MQHTADVVVIGGGAAGLMCAAVAARTGKSVVVVEHNNAVGKKIRISGGGRCNFTNREVTCKNFLSANPHFSRSALARYTPLDFIALIDAYGIAWHEKTLGQLFCDGSAQQVIDMLQKECSHANVRTILHANCSSVSKSEVFTTQTSVGPITSHAVVVASGGLSIPSLGASDLGYRIASHFGVPMLTPEPALVPLSFDESTVQQYRALSGVSVDAVAEAQGVAFRENVLFTHRGLSGPAILQISSYLQHGEAFTLDVLPDDTWQTLFPDYQRDRRSIATVIGYRLTKRFAQVWPDERFSGIVNETPRAVLEEIIRQLQSWTILPSGTEGFAKAEVTRGGVDTRALSSKTMEASTVPGLYFIGEVVDVTGWLGGYNFQWAWSSAVAAGTALQQA